jgi:ABC-type polysaccharide/polyol phosphate transport system ATPase subunit
MVGGVLCFCAHEEQYRLLALENMVSIELTDVSLRYPVLHPVDLSVKSTFKQLATGGRILASGRRTVEVAALEDINLQIKEGERVGVIGHNGAGKTTLLKLIAGIYRAQKGRFRREGDSPP